MLSAWTCPAQTVKLDERPLDPHGSPRPPRDARDVPLQTSLYFELNGVKEGVADPKTVTVTLQPEDGPSRTLLGPEQRFGPGASGWLRHKQDLSGARSLAVYIEPGEPLLPSKSYSVAVSVGENKAGSWRFSTEAAPAAHPIAFPLDLGSEPVQWHGRFFSGLCNVIFCSQAENYGATYELMAEARKEHPRAWAFQRDFWPTGTEFRPAGFLPQRLPNIVRERETRRIAAIEPRNGNLVLRLEDVFGNVQYGIPDGRPVDDDYHPGDEVLIADGIHDARTKVVSVDRRAGSVTVAKVAEPAGGWKIAYEGALPTKEDPDAPGLVPPGGCYLRKFAPHGTACYYWGRLDKEWDLAHRKYGRRLMVNFADATGDLSRDGRSWTTVKDYAQWHDAVRTIAGHVIDRYGKDSLDFTWSVFNEPDLGPLFWRADFKELLTFYDYTTDGILRAFEDRGYDSSKVFIGGLELGAIFGTNLVKLREFLVHCSPSRQADDALPANAAFADSRLEGKRSKRVEAFCKAHVGKGSPCDFVSIHSYNRAELMANKLIRAKELALEVDAEYYSKLWVNSHESCPDWMPPPDEAATDSYLGNGYFPTWCLDVVHRQLLRAAADPRYAYGETILTVWPPPANFTGINGITRVLQCDDDGDGRADRTVTVPFPIFHALGLLSDMGDRYWVLPDQRASGHIVSGFASSDDRGTVRLLLYAHQAQDTQSRSGASFDITVNLEKIGWQGPARLREYRFDRDHNSPFRTARTLHDQPPTTGSPDPERLAALERDLAGSDPAAQIKALKSLPRLDAAAHQTIIATILQLAQSAKDTDVRESAMSAIRGAMGPRAYPKADVERVVKLCECRPTRTATVAGEADGRVKVAASLTANGCCFLVIDRDAEPGR